jgi:hypothetical protein
MTRKISIVLLTILYFCNSCNSQNCKDIPTTFSSYNSATIIIKKAVFKITDNLPADKSSWITSATFYSCDGNYGFIIYTTDKGREYIHQNLPLNIWNSFKSATSSGSYYDHNIKGRYRLVLN